MESPRIRASTSLLEDVAWYLLSAMWLLAGGLKFSLLTEPGGAHRPEFGVGIIECLTSVLIFSADSRRIGSIIASITLLGFTVHMTVSPHTSCACFGTLDGGPVWRSASLVARGVLLAGLIIYSEVRKDRVSRKSHHTPVHRLVIIGLVVGTAISVISASLSTNPG